MFCILFFAEMQDWTETAQNISSLLYHFIYTEKCENIKLLCKRKGNSHFPLWRYYFQTYTQVIKGKVAQCKNRFSPNENSFSNKSKIHRREFYSLR